MRTAPALRVPGIEDADEIARVHVTSWQETFADQLPPGFFSEEYREKRREMWRTILAKPAEGSAVIVAESDGSIVGFACAGPPLDADAPRPLHLYTLYLLQAFHGGGAGQAMLDAVVGLRSAYLWAAERNPRAQAFYERNGFVADGTTKEDAAVVGIRAFRMVR